MSFEGDYRDLIIKQYWDKPKARAEIELQAGTWGRAFDWLDSFIAEFDLDTATGERLDIIGRIVGQPRLILCALARVFFGFADNPSAGLFDDKTIDVAGSAPLKSKWERAYTAYELNDNQYRIFIKAKVARNTTNPDLPSITAAVLTLFDGCGYAVDNKDMSLTLYVSPDFTEELLTAILQSDLLPKPGGVRHTIVIGAAPWAVFGFAENESAQPFANKFDLANEPGGFFSRKIFIANQLGV